jgi:hypothetical protein
MQIICNSKSVPLTVIHCGMALTIVAGLDRAGLREHDISPQTDR